MRVIFLYIVLFLNNIYSYSGQQSYLKYHYSIENGLPSNLISDLNFDNNGYIWIATQAGLSRFDGKDFLTFSSYNVNSILSNRFITIDKDRLGNLFIINDVYQLFKIDKYSKLVHLSNKIYGRDFIVTHDEKIIFIDNNKIDLSMKEYLLYFNSFNNYYKLYQDSIIYNSKKKLINKSLVFKNYKSFFIDSLFFVLDSRLFLNIFDKGILVKKINLKNYINEKYMYGQVHFSKNNNNVTLSVNKRVYRVMYIKNILKFEPINVLFDNDDGYTYVENNKFKINLIYSQRNGFWIVKKNPFKIVTKIELNKGSRDVYRVLIDYQQEVKSCFESSMVGCKHLDEFNLWFNKSNDTVCFFYKDKIEYLGKNRNIQYKVIFKGNNDVSDRYHDIVKTRYGNFILKNDIIYRFTGLNKLDFIFKFPFGTITSANVFYKNKSWIISGERKGLFLFDEKTKKIDSINQFKNMTIRYIQYDTLNGVYWIFTYGNGVFVIDNFLNVKPLLIFNNNLISFSHYFLNDRYNNFWIPTNNGLVCFSQNQIKQFLTNNNKEVYIQYYDVSHGLKNNEFNGRYSNSGIKLPTGELAFSNMAGIIIINPNDFQEKMSESSIFVDNVLYNDSINYKGDFKNIKLKESFVNLIFSFSSPNYSFNKGSFLEYQIPEIDSNWLALDDNKLKLVKLSAGTYSIFVRRKGLSDLENDIFIKLIVIPLWYKSLTAYIIYFIMVIVFVIYIVYFIYIRKKQVIENEIVLINSELKALRAQINPHYLSNSLMSLQSAVLDNDKEKAFEFIGQYGKVMRNILEKSNYSFISLEQEIETIKEYIKLEGLIRNLNIEFNYLFNSDNNLANLKNVKVPTMIFQPFVENSILHGLIPKKDDVKIINFNINLTNNKLHVLISDNGIGFENKNSNRKSYGLENVRNRLSSYSKLLKTDASFKIERLKSENENFNGTQVSIFLPFLLEYEKPFK